MDAPLLVENRSEVRWLIFNRPEKHNAQDPAMLEALDAALDEIPSDPSVRAVVLAGNGRSFCSGHDLRQAAENPVYMRNASTVEGRFRQERRLFSGPVNKFRELPVPTVCRVQGYCLAAGLMFASAADFVIAGSSASFGSPIIATLGVNDAETASFALRVGERWAKRVCWLDERLDAETARQAGLVTWVVPDDELDAKVDDVTTRLVASPRESMALSKESLLFLAERQGERDVNRFHFMAHQLSHWTEESTSLLADRVRRVNSGGPVVADIS